MAVEGVERKDTTDRVMSHLAWAGLDGLHQVAAIPLDRRHTAKIDGPAIERLLERDAIRLCGFRRTAPESRLTAVASVETRAF